MDKMVFYKMSSNEMIFQLVSLEVKEDFSLWDNTAKRYLRQLDGVANINDIKFMKQELFVQRYPHLRKNTQYVREIVVYEQQPTQYLFGFKKTANDDLNKAITNNSNLGVNPLEVLYKLRKTGIEKDTTYAIVVLERVGLPKNVIQSQMAAPQQQAYPLQNAPQIQKPYMQTMQKPAIMPQSVQTPIQQQTPQKVPESISKVQFGVPNVQKMVVLQDGAEKEIYEASLNYPEKLTEEKYIELWNECAREYFGTQFELQRIKDIYRELYYK